MIEKYKNNYDLYLEDQITRFESFEGDLYREGIKKTIDHIWPIGEQFGRVLDFCCGDGTTSLYLSRKGFSVVGFDANPRKITKAMRLPNFTGDEFVVSNAENLGETWFARIKYNFIYASHCFEHFLEPMAILKHTQRLLAPEGQIILVLPYPNTESEGHPGSEKLKLHLGPNEIIGNFQDHGFIVDKIEQVNFREPELIIHLR